MDSPGFAVPSFFGNGDGDENMKRRSGSALEGGASRSHAQQLRQVDQKGKSKLGGSVVRDESDIFGPMPSIFHHLNPPANQKPGQANDTISSSAPPANPPIQPTQPSAESVMHHTQAGDLPFSVSSGEGETGKSLEATRAADVVANIAGQVGTDLGNHVNTGSGDDIEAEGMEVDEAGGDREEALAGE